MTQWKLVPVDLDEDMREVLTNFWMVGDENYTEVDAYRAMLNAAPEAPDVVAALEEALFILDTLSDAAQHDVHVLWRKYNTDGVIARARLVLSQLKGEGA
jgi:hypothetical protein